MEAQMPDTPLVSAVADLEKTLLDQIRAQKISTRDLLQKVYAVREALIKEQALERRTESGIILQ